MRAPYNLRKAVTKDIPEIYAMAYELAKMQDLVERFCLTDKILQKMIEDPQEATTTLIVEKDNVICAFAMYTLLKNNRLYHRGFAMYIDEIYVKTQHRNQGIGSSLFKYIGEQAIAHGCNRLEWWVTHDNLPAIRFYENMGARALDELKTFRLQEPALSAFVADTTGQ